METSTPNTSQTKCWKCGAAISAQDRYCRHCGNGQGKYVKWYYQPTGILLLILLIGPFALYNVIKSPSMSKSAKWLLAGIIILFTVLFGVQIYKFIVAFNNTMNALTTGSLDSLF